MKVFIKSVALFMEIFAPVILIGAFFVVYMMAPGEQKGSSSLISTEQNNVSI